GPAAGQAHRGRVGDVQAAPSVLDGVQAVQNGSFDAVEEQSGLAAAADGEALEVQAGRVPRLDHGLGRVLDREVDVVGAVAHAFDLEVPGAVDRDGPRGLVAAREDLDPRAGRFDGRDRGREVPVARLEAVLVQPLVDDAPV